MIEESRPGVVVTYETRRESNEKVDRQKRYSQIKYILSRFPEGLTAKEIAVQMKALGYCDNDDRNNSSPRLNELMNMGIVEPYGKKKCEYTNKTVSVYRLKAEPKQLEIGDYLW